MTTPQVTILRLPEVIARVKLGRDSVYRLARQGRFPKPVKLSERASGWVESEIDAYLMKCAEMRPQQQLPQAA